VVQRHRHLVCLACNEILDVRPAGEAELALPPEEQHGYEMVSVNVFRGRCPRCQRHRP
jgi:Fe2+ or Zn2+ uptake regulation protein